MIVKVTGTGTSFKGAAAYYLHDKDADTAERVAWTHTDNLATDDPHQAWKIMAYTAKHQAELKRAAGVKATGRKLQQPVLTMAVSWHEDEVPDQAHMLETAQEAVATLGLDHHEAVYVSHRDEKHAHVHIMLNRVDPTNGKAATLSFSKRRLQAWALEYEQKHGHIRCPQRLENAEARKRNAKKRPDEREVIGYGDNVIRDAWARSDSGKAFVAALATEGYHLARGQRGRLVVVDKYGKATNPTRELPGVRVKQLRERLSDVDLDQLPDAAAVKKHITRHRKAQYAKEVQASRKFDKWASLSREETAKRQNAARKRLASSQRTEMKRKRAEMVRQYKLRSQHAAIVKLRETVGRPSTWKRVTGKAKQERQQLQAMILNFRSALGRAKEEVGALRVRHEEAAADLEAVHQAERDRLHDLIAERKPDYYRKPEGKKRPATPELGREAGRRKARDERNQRRPDRGRGRGRERGHGPDGPNDP